MAGPRLAEKVEVEVTVAMWEVEENRDAICKKNERKLSELGDNPGSPFSRPQEFIQSFLPFPPFFLVALWPWKWAFIAAKKKIVPDQSHHCCIHANFPDGSFQGGKKFRAHMSPFGQPFSPMWLSGKRKRRFSKALP